MQEFEKRAVNELRDASSKFDLQAFDKSLKSLEIKYKEIIEE